MSSDSPSTPPDLRQTVLVGPLDERLWAGLQETYRDRVSSAVLASFACLLWKYTRVPSHAFDVVEVNGR